MNTKTNTKTDLLRYVGDHRIDDAELAAIAFLARYSNRTLDAYRHDLKSFFEWANQSNIVVLEATRPHVELYRHHMEQRE